MADLLSELERFEQEMKELGSEPSSSLVPPPHLVAQVPLPVIPPPPPPRPSVAPPAVVALASADSLGSSGAFPSSAASPSLPSKLPTQTLPTTNPTLPSPPLTTPTPPPGPSPHVVPPVSVASPMPWLAGSSAANSPVAPLTTTSSPQFTFLRGNMSYPALVSNVSTPSPPQSMPMPSSVSYYARGPSQPPLSQPQHYQQYHNQQHYQPPQQQLPAQPTVIQAPQYHYQALYQSLPEMYHHPQQQQAQQLFQKDAQTITPEALEHVKAALASGDGEQKSEAKRKAVPRKAAGQTWEDPTLADWPENDFRLFCGDLGNEVNDEVLTKAFSRFSTFNMAKVVRDKRTGKTKGYGFVSFASSSDLALALKEMNGKYVGNRPIKLRKSTWKERTDFDAYEKHKTAKKPKTSKKNVLHK